MFVTYIALQTHFHLHTRLLLLLASHLHAHTFSLSFFSRPDWEHAPLPLILPHFTLLCLEDFRFADCHYIPVWSHLQNSNGGVPPLVHTTMCMEWMWWVVQVVGRAGGEEEAIYKGGVDDGPFPRQNFWFVSILGYNTHSPKYNLYWVRGLDFARIWVLWFGQDKRIPFLLLQYQFCSSFLHNEWWTMDSFERIWCQQMEICRHDILLFSPVMSQNSNEARSHTCTSSL